MCFVCPCFLTVGVDFIYFVYGVFVYFVHSSIQPLAAILQ